MNWTKQQSIYERKAYRIIQDHIKRILNDLPINNVSVSTLNYLLQGNISEEKIKDMFVEIYTTIGFNYAKKVNLTFESYKKKNILFNDVLLEQILLFLSNEGGIKIISVRETLIESIIKAVNEQLNEQNSLIDIRDAIYNVVRKSQSFYKWQALRIARTETTCASGFAAYQSALQSELVMEKQWISAKDDRTRLDHVIENGQKVDLEKPFIMADGSELLYPGDIKGKASQVINCRCTIGFVPKRDEDGMLMIKK